MPPLRLALLGGFQAREASGQPVPLAKAKAKALLAYLAMHPGQAFARDKLAALLWPDFPEEQARHSLRQALLTLRRAIPPPGLRVEGDTVSAPAALLAVDVDDFEQSIARGTLEALAEATALYQGEFLEGLRVSEAPFEDWLLGERERLRELAIGGLRKLLASERAAGLSGQATRSAIRLVAADPLQETAHRALMELYAESGQYGRALRQYRVCSEILLRELGARPEPETEKVYQDLLRRRAGDRPTERIHAPASGSLETRSDPCRDVRLVGRDAERATLESALESARAARGRVVTIRGETGVGKSRLVEEVAATARRAGARVVTGRSYELEQILPFGPWLDALRPIVATERTALRELDPAWQRELIRLFPEITRSKPASPGDSVSPVQLFEAVAQLVSWLSHDRPLVLILEDLHWSDETSLQLLSFAARRVHEQRVLILATVRDEEVAEVPAVRRLLSALDREPRNLRLPLPPLSPAATATLVRSLAPIHCDPATLADLERRAWEASEGNPFVVVEIVRELQPDRASGSGGGSLPARVSEMIAARLDGLGEREATLVAVAAVIGREFDPVLLRLATDMDAGEVAAAVETLIRRRILAARGNRLDFVHDRIRRVAANRLAPPRRTLLHARVARAIAQLHVADLAAHAGPLALHFLQGEVWEEAVVHLHMAGRQAAARLAHREAAVYLQQAIEALPHLGETGDRVERAIDLRLDLRDVLQPIGENERLLERLGEAERLAHDRGDPRRLGWCLAFMCHILWETGQLAAARAYGQRARDIATTLADRALAAEADRRLAQACLSAGEYREACERLTAAVLSSAADRQVGRLGLPNIDPIGGARGWLAWALGEQGLFGEGIAAGREGARLARAAGHPRAEVMALLGLAELHCIRGEPSLTITWLEGARELVQRYDLQGMVFPVNRTLGYAYALAGRLTEGLALLRQAMAIAQSLSYRRPFATRCLEQFGRACLLDGQLEEAQDLANRAHIRACDRGERGLEAYALRLLADIAAWPEQPDVDAAVARFREALALAASLGMRPLAARCHHGLGELYRRAGRPRAAREQSRLAKKLAGELGLADIAT